MLRITCPCCGVGIKAEERLIGQTIRCPKCLSTTIVKRTKPDNLATHVEPSYDPRKQEEDSPRPTACPKCGNHLEAGQYLCGQCGYHIKLEAYFEDLTSEALTKGTEPKTKGEKWLEEQLHELATPRDVLIASGLCAIFLGVVAVIGARIFFGPLLGTISGLILSSGLAFGWYELMKRLGCLKDSKREERINRERSERIAKISHDPNGSREVSEKISKPIVEINPSAGIQNNSLSLPNDEYDAEDIDLFDDSPPKSKPSPTKQAVTSKPKRASTSASPQEPPPSQQKQESKGEDDWLNDLL